MFFFKKFFFEAEMKKAEQKPNSSAEEPEVKVGSWSLKVVKSYSWVKATFDEAEISFGPIQFSPSVEQPMSTAEGVSSK